MATEEDIKWLQEKVGLQEFYMENSHPEMMMQLDDEMHRKLFMICHRELTYGMCQKLAIHYDQMCIRDSCLTGPTGACGRSG